MQNDKTCSEIINSFVRTRTEANMLLSELDLIAASLYKTGEGNYASVMETFVRAKVSYALAQVTNDGNREEIINLLSQKIKSLEYLELTVAFEPNLEIVGRIGNWVRLNVGENVALDIKIDPQILGGAIIEYKGRVGNFSILPQINEYFLLNNVNV